jgi:hypothetical protein
MMLTHSSALWRIEYQTNLTRAHDPVLPLAYMLEAYWNNGVRWLGMLFRKRLTPLEIDRVDMETWPEMKELPLFMNGLFERAWNSDVASNRPLPLLGSNSVATNFSGRSSLHFAGDEPSITLSNDDPEQSFADLYTRLLRLHSALSPRLVAEVHPLPQPKKDVPVIKPTLADVEQVSRAA